jgi:hypothetical protein
MEGEIVQFPNRPERTGYTKFDELYFELENFFTQHNDPDIKSNDREVIEKKIEEVRKVAEKVRARIDEMDGIQVAIPKPQEFREALGNLFSLVFTNQSRVSLDYYEIPMHINQLANDYEAKYNELTGNQLDRI